MILVKHLIAIHHSNEILCIREINDVMRIAREHMHTLDIVPRYLKLNDLISANLALLDQSMPSNHNKELPLRVVPVLTLGNPGLRDVDRDLTAVQRMHQLRKRPTIIHIHLQRKRHFRCRQIRKIRRIQLLRETPSRNLRYHQRLGLLRKLMQQINNLPQCRFMSYRTVTVPTLCGNHL